MTDPTPAQLREMAEWFDSPSRAPNISVQVGTRTAWTRYTPGYLLRLIADGLERAQQGDNKHG